MQVMNMATAMITETTPKATKTCCQPMASDMSANGVAALSDPMLPTARSMPLAVANSYLRNQTASIFIIGMYTMAAPSPIRRRPATISSKLVATPQSTAPAARIKVNMPAVFLGPQLSVRIPLGNCIIVYV